MINSKLARLIFGFALVTFASCSDREPEMQTATKTTPPANPSDPKLQMELYVKEFETTINAEKKVQNRSQIIQDYAEIFYDFAKEHSGTELGIEAWSYVMGLGKGTVKEEALQTVLKIVEKDLDSEKSIQRLGEVFRNGNDHYQSVSLGHLNTIASADPATDHSINGLRLLATMKEFDDQTRTAALQRWLNECLALNATDELVARLSEHQCQLNETWLRKIANQSRGEIQAEAVVRLAMYLNRRDAVRDFYRDAPLALFEGMAEELRRYLNAPIDHQEQRQLVELLRSIRSSNEQTMETARRELFAIEHLAIGKEVPEIEGNDLDGVSFKLSDYRGKVVLLDFWGDW